MIGIWEGVVKMQVKGQWEVSRSRKSRLGPFALRLGVAQSSGSQQDHPNRLRACSNVVIVVVWQEGDF